jgi:Tol biopolymer transport system component
MPGKQGSMLRVTRKTVVGPLVFSKAIASVGPRFQQVSYPIGFRIFLFAFLVSLSGCPFGSPRDHYRAIGQQDTTVAVAPMDDTIVFNAVGAGGRDLYLLDVRSRIVSRIAETPDYETSASFSPDGRRIVYSAGVPGDRADHIFTMDRNGNSKEQLTDIDANDTSGKYSPDGERIVFARDKTYNWGGMAANWGTGGVICIIDADGTNFRQLTIDEEFAFNPYFSADGTHVIYSTASERRSIPVDRNNGRMAIAVCRNSSFGRHRSMELT